MTDKTLTLDKILTPNANLATMLAVSQLTTIGQNVIRDVEIDEKSREDWAKSYDSWLDTAMQVRKAKITPWPNASNIRWPMLTVASIQFQARAYPAIVDGSNLVKAACWAPILMARSASGLIASGST